MSSVFRFSHHSVSGSDRVAHVGELVFRDDSSRNSFRLETSREVLKILPKIEKTCDALLFRSEGRVFCSGGNLKDHLAQGPSKGRLANREITKCLSRLSGLSIPTVALVEGDVLGGGLELLSAFDSVMSVPEALFGLWQRRLGLSFGWGGGQRMLRLMSAHELSRLALESRPLTAAAAMDIGFVDRLTPTWSAHSDALTVASHLALLPKSSVQAMKDLRKIPAADSRREQIAFEKLWFGPAHKARLTEFSKR